MFTRGRGGTAAALLALLASLALAAGCGGDDESSGGGESAGGSGAEAEELVEIRVGQANQAANFTSFVAAIDEGIFEKYGLDVEAVVTERGGQAPGLLQAGEVQFALDSGEPMITAIAKGVDIELLAATGNRFGFVLLARKPATEVEDLKGKKLALSSPTGAVGTAGAELLRRFNLEEEVEIVYISDIAARLAALESGSVDAIILSPPVAQVMESGKVNQILDLREDFQFLMVGLWAMGDYVEQNPEVVESFLKAMNESADFVNDPANKEAVIEHLSTATGFEDPAGLEESYEYEIARLPDNIKVEKEAVQNVLDFLDRKGEIQTPELESFLNLDPMESALGDAGSSG